ncbi:hypothetical protein [Pseudomonas extremaustralis]|nr:hypothetical protein [Pseudomonas extremaustralis]MDB1112964.1 hypothetical protein [Pseudomonas extremaustralis]
MQQTIAASATTHANPHSSLAPSMGSLLIVLVFIAGMAVGAKMAGGW